MLMSFNGKLRDDLLAREVVDTLRAARAAARAAAEFAAGISPVRSARRPPRVGVASRPSETV
jgi:hypothetical protein